MALPFLPFVSTLAKLIMPDLTASITTIIKKRIDKQITDAELEAEVQKAVLSTFASVEEKHADTLADTYSEFQKTVRTSPAMQFMLIAVVMSQLLVLLWHQVGIPAIIALGYVSSYPPSGSTVTWAYALVGAGIGLGPLALRTGPGAGGIANKIKSLTTKR